MLIMGFSVKSTSLWVSLKDLCRLLPESAFCQNFEMERFSLWQEIKIFLPKDPPVLNFAGLITQSSSCSLPALLSSLIWRGSKDHFDTLDQELCRLLVIDLWSLFLLGFVVTYRLQFLRCILRSFPDTNFVPFSWLYCCWEKS